MGNGKLLYSTGSSYQCSGMTWKGGLKGRKGQRGGVGSFILLVLIYPFLDDSGRTFEKVRVCSQFSSNSWEASSSHSIP